MVIMPIQNGINIVEKLINSGCLMQIDAGSLFHEESVS